MNEELKGIKLTLRNQNNEFDKIFGEGYGARFARVVEGSPIERFDYMASLVSYADQDESLSESKRKLIHEMENAFRDACFFDNDVPQRLKSLIDSKPNLKKMIKPVREQRIYDTLMAIPRRLGFKVVVNANIMPMMFMASAAYTGKWKYMKQDIAYSITEGVKSISGLYFAALLSKYTINIGLFDYPNMWFVMMVMKTLSSNAILNEKLILDEPRLIDYTENLFNTVSYMIETIEPDLYNGLVIAD